MAQISLQEIKVSQCNIVWKDRDCVCACLKGWGGGLDYKVLIVHMEWPHVCICCIPREPQEPEM